MWVAVEPRNTREVGPTRLEPTTSRSPADHSAFATADAQSGPSTTRASSGTPTSGCSARVARVRVRNPDACSRQAATTTSSACRPASGGYIVRPAHGEGDYAQPRGDLARHPSCFDENRGGRRRVAPTPNIVSWNSPMERFRSRVPRLVPTSAKGVRRNIRVLSVCRASVTRASGRRRPLRAVPSLPRAASVLLPGQAASIGPGADGSVVVRAVVAVRVVVVVIVIAITGDRQGRRRRGGRRRCGTGAGARRWCRRRLGGRVGGGARRQDLPRIAWLIGAGAGRDGRDDREAGDAAAVARARGMAHGSVLPAMRRTTPVDLRARTLAGSALTSAACSTLMYRPKPTGSPLGCGRS